MTEQAYNKIYSHDVEFFSEGYFATVEYKTRNGVTSAYWSVSGPVSLTIRELVLQLVIALPAVSEQELTAICAQQFEAHVIPLARMASATGGLTSSVFGMSAEKLGLLVSAHVRAASNVPRWSDGPPTVMEETARNYKLVQSFGASKPIEVLAQAEGVKVNAIKQRVYLARKAGIIAPASKTSPKLGGNNA